MNQSKGSRFLSTSQIQTRDWSTLADNCLLEVDYIDISLASLESVAQFLGLTSSLLCSCSLLHQTLGEGVLRGIKNCDLQKEQVYKHCLCA